jgi:hypothetical protein
MQYEAPDTSASAPGVRSGGSMQTCGHASVTKAIVGSPLDVSNEFSLSEALRAFRFRTAIDNQVGSVVSAHNGADLTGPLLKVCKHHFFLFGR